MIRVTYKGVDITGSVSVNRCYHDMYAGGQSDTLHIRVNDIKGLWTSWAPTPGDEIRVDYGSISTGAMFVTDAKPQNGIFDIVAQSVPKSGFDIQHKAWQQVRLFQIGDEIANRNGLEFRSYGVDDKLYSYVMQNGVGDIRFLHSLALLEGCSVIVYDRKLIMYNEAYMEAQAPIEFLQLTNDGDFRYNDRSGDLFGSCVVDNGMYHGEFSVSNGSTRVYRPQQAGTIGSNEDAQRFARNLLRSVNKGCISGYVYASILPGYAPASTVKLMNDRAPAWNGTVFLDHVRNDYGKQRSKIFFRKPLEGY